MRRFDRARVAQVRVVSRLLLLMQRLPFVSPVLSILGRSNFIAALLVGYKRAFRSKTEADICLARIDPLSHSHPYSVPHHLSLSKRARPSDYPILTHMSRFLSKTQRVADVGGNCGNLFYCYDSYLAFPSNFTWVVFDLPNIAAEGRKLAADRGEVRLSFVDTLELCDGANIVLFSGSLHYFEEMPAELMRGWKTKPQHIFINRSPVTSAASVYGIQDVTLYFASAKVLNRDELFYSMKTAGYKLIDEWTVAELNLRFPLHPQHSAEMYSGFLFSLVPSNREQDHARRIG